MEGKRFPRRRFIDKAYCHYLARSAYGHRIWPTLRNGDDQGFISRSDAADTTWNSGAIWWRNAPCVGTQALFTLNGVASRGQHRTIRNTDPGNTMTQSEHLPWWRMEQVTSIHLIPVLLTYTFSVFFHNN